MESMATIFTLSKCQSCCKEIINEIDEFIRPFSGCMHDSQYANISVDYLISKNVWKIRCDNEPKNINGTLRC